MTLVHMHHEILVFIMAECLVTVLCETFDLGFLMPSEISASTEPCAAVWTGDRFWCVPLCVNGGHLCSVGLRNWPSRQLVSWGMGRILYYFVTSIKKRKKCWLRALEAPYVLVGCDCHQSDGQISGEAGPVR